MRIRNATFPDSFTGLQVMKARVAGASEDSSPGHTNAFLFPEDQ
jgi:hypothetical protein